MPARKLSANHGADDTERTERTDSGNAVLNKLRNMWQFANLCQWIYIFGKAIRLDDAIDIEEIEKHCLQPDSTLLAEIAVAILRVISNHRGLTLDGVDSQAQKQYLAHAPDHNPFGSDEPTTKFQDLDVYTKITVLQQFTQWAMIHPERLREKMEEQKDTEQATWRIEPYGWDSDDRTYFVLDDNRVYRLTEAPPPPQTPARKKKTVQQYGKRSSKRRRTDRGAQEVAASATEPSQDAVEESVDDGLGGMKWECLAISLEQVRGLIDLFRKTRDGNEQVLVQQLEEHLLPILEKQEESRKRRALQRDRDLANLAKLANAKRSSRIAGKVEQQKQEEKIKEEERLSRVAEEARIKQERAQLKQEQQREARLASREKRLHEREARRRQYTEELAQLSAEDSKRADSAAGRASERRIQSAIEKNKQALEALEDDDDEDWVFDCICGLFGQVDDGAHSVACETCNVWQHSKCLGISEEDAERPEFRFVCKSCRHKENAETRQKPLIKLKVSHPTAPESQEPPASPTKATPATEQKPRTESVPELTGFSSNMTSKDPVEQRPPVVPSLNSEVSTPEPNRTSSQPVSQDSDESNADQPQGHVQEQSRSPSQLNSKEQKSSSDCPPAVPAKIPTSLTRPFHEHKLLPRTSMNTADGGTLPGDTSPPSQAGISPVKPPSHDSLTPVRSKVSSISSKNDTSASVPISPNTMMLPPEVTLAPSPSLPILTPPTKHSEPVRAPKRQ